jgi:DNA-binding MarR family transcriptional regulator
LHDEPVQALINVRATGVSSMDEKEKTVLDAMKNEGKPIRPGDLAKVANMESKEVSKIIDSLKKKGLVISPKRCYYSPVED